MGVATYSHDEGVMLMRQDLKNAGVKLSPLVSDLIRAVHLSHFGDQQTDWRVRLADQWRERLADMKVEMRRMSQRVQSLEAGLVVSSIESHARRFEQIPDLEQRHLRHATALDDAITRYKEGSAGSEEMRRADESMISLWQFKKKWPQGFPCPSTVEEVAALAKRWRSVLESNAKNHAGGDSLDSVIESITAPAGAERPTLDLNTSAQFNGSISAPLSEEEMLKKISG